MSINTDQMPDHSQAGSEIHTAFASNRISQLKKVIVILKAEHVKEDIVETQQELFVVNLEAL